MKALFLVFHGFSPISGISKKIHAQVKAMNECGMETSLCYYNVEKNGDRVWKCDDQAIVNFGKGLIAKLKKRFCYQPLLNYISENQISFIYIRSDHNANPFTIRFIKGLRRRGVKVVMEIPTYPYDQEYITWDSKCYLFVDKLFRKTLASHLNAIITFSNQKEIFGQRTIQISNGIDFSSIPLRERKSALENEIHLIGVAEIHYWHGYDRLIAGMAEYYKTDKENQIKVFFHLVGDFSGERERNDIVPLLEQNGLEKYIFIHGPLHGDELNELFNLSDIGIGSLARHRTNIMHIKTLKNREYAARGIPFIYSEIDDDFEAMPYIMKVPADDTPINIKTVIDFYRQKQMKPEDIRHSILSLSWTVQFEKVLNILQE